MKETPEYLKILTEDDKMTHKKVKDRQPKNKIAINYWDETGNLARIFQENTGPAKMSAQQWASLLARVVKTCEKHNPDWRRQDDGKQL